MKRILFCAHDIGGGNAILPVVGMIMGNAMAESLCLVGGPSKEIFKREKIDFIDADSMADRELLALVRDFKLDTFISGNSGGITFDKKILTAVRGTGVKTFYILDFWAYYWQRFSGKEKDFAYLPEHILVMDEIAKSEMVAEGFDPKIIEVTGNPYLEYFQNKLRRVRGDKNKILFVSQYEDRADVLEDILDILDGESQDFRLIIRPHPKEGATKFDKYIGRRVRVDSESLIEDLVASSGLLIGIDSMVLFQAAIAGKLVISYQPGMQDKDFLISNRFGLSKLVTTKNDLSREMRRYFDGQFLLPKGDRESIIVKDALKKIVDLITI